MVTFSVYQWSTSGNETRLGQQLASREITGSKAHRPARMSHKFAANFANRRNKSSNCLSLEAIGNPHLGGWKRQRSKSIWVPKTAHATVGGSVVICARCWKSLILVVSSR